MRVFLVILGVFVHHVKCLNFTQPSHMGLTQAARLNCWKTESEFFMKFLLYKNADQIELVYAVEEQDLGDMSVGVFDSNGNGIEGTGEEEFPFTFIINGTGSLDTGIILSPPTNTDKKARVLGKDVIRVDVMSKSRFEPTLLPYVVFAEDVVYTAACNFSEIQDQFVDTGGISVNGSSMEAAPKLTETATLQAVVNASPTTTVTIGDDMSLLASLDYPSLATGLHVHSCLICDTADCGGSVQLEFIDNYGCSVGNYISPFENAGFLSAATPNFPVFSLANQSTVFFQCTVNFCYNLDDLRCQSYCTFRSARRKRDLNDTETVLGIQIENKTNSVNESKRADESNIIDQENPLNTSMSQNSTESANETKFVRMTLEITVVRLAQVPSVSEARITPFGDSDVTLLAPIIPVVVLLLVVLIVAIVVFCRMKARRKDSSDA